MDVSRADLRSARNASSSSSDSQMSAVSSSASVVGEACCARANCSSVRDPAASPGTGWRCSLTAPRYRQKDADRPHANRASSCSEPPRPARRGQVPRGLASRQRARAWARLGRARDGVHQRPARSDGADVLAPVLSSVGGARRCKRTTGTGLAPRRAEEDSVVCTAGGFGRTRSRLALAGDLPAPHPATAAACRDVGSFEPSQ